MKKVTMDMPLVSQCTISECAYNVNNNCHARAITIGDGLHAGCDTYFNNPGHTKDMTRIAGIGACKSVQCKFNEDFECMTDSITVGRAGQEVNCLTFSPR